MYFVRILWNRFKTIRQLLFYFIKWSAVWRTVVRCAQHTKARTSFSLCSASAYIELYEIVYRSFLLIWQFDCWILWYFHAEYTYDYACIYPLFCKNNNLSVPLHSFVLFAALTAVHHLPSETLCIKRKDRRRPKICMCPRVAVPFNP